MRKRTNRKVWRLVNPLEHAIAGASLVPRGELDTLLRRELASLDDFTKGHATMQQWHDLACVVNLCETLGKAGVGPEALESCAQAQDALIDAAKRFTKSQRFGLTGLGIQAIRDVLEFHDLQRSSIPRSQYEEAIRLTIARVKSGHNVVDVNEVCA